MQYIVKIDKGNRSVLWADAHTGAAMRSEHQFLHNTKISRSAINEKEAFDQSRQASHPVGRHIGLPQMLHQILGDRDVYSTFKFDPVETTPFEYRSTTKIKLNKEGNLQRGRDTIPDTASEESHSCSIRKLLLPEERQFTPAQCLLLQPGKSAASYNKIALFGLRPVELLELFPTVREYTEWFTAGKALSRDDIAKGLDKDVKQCQWIDGIGRRILLRRQAFHLAKARLQRIRRSDVSSFSWELCCHLLKIIDEGTNDPLFIVDDVGQEMPIAVFSRISPNRSANFLMHIMIVLGEFKTELDLRQARTLRESLAKAKLIPSGGHDDPDTLRRYAIDLTRRVFDEILPLQPVSMTKMDEFIVKTDQLLEAVIVHDTIPITDLPPCILTELLNDQNKALREEWDNRKASQLDAMYPDIEKMEGVPKRDRIESATKINPVKWNFLDTIVQSDIQSDESFAEQMLALRIGFNAVMAYCTQFGNPHYTKGMLLNGSPGAGKTFVATIIAIFAMSQGLRVLSTSLMAVRANALGGYNLHRLFAWSIGHKANLFQNAEVSDDGVLLM